MLARVVRAVSLLSLGALGSCGLLAGPEPVAPPGACARLDPAPDRVAGVMLRHAEGAAAFELLPVEGERGRGGRIQRLEAGGQRLDVARLRGRGDGGGETAGSPLPGDGAVETLTLPFRQGGERFGSETVVGTPTPGSRLPTGGRATYAGTVRLTLGQEDRAARMLAGTARVTVLFGSERVDIVLEALEPVEAAGDPAPDAASAPSPGFARLAWSNLGLCGTRIGSTGQGSLVAHGSGGDRLPLEGAARLNAQFFGFDVAQAVPAALGGVLVVQDDGGALTGVFVARAGADTGAD
jgi:hypothetical protein